jgi:hypothetical protein
LLLGKARGCDQQQGKAGYSENPACHLFHVVLPKVLPAKSAISSLMSCPRKTRYFRQSTAAGVRS